MTNPDIFAQQELNQMVEQRAAELLSQYLSISEIRMKAIQIANGDIEKAKSIVEFVMGVENNESTNEDEPLGSGEFPTV